MDMASIQLAFTGLTTIKNLLQGAVKLGIKNATLEPINEALDKVSAVQETLFNAREELFKLQTENNQLRDKIKSFEDWEKMKDGYGLIESPGGAHVYASKSNSPKHYVCPSCFVKREIQILQDSKNVLGNYICPSCKAAYPVKPRQR